MPRKPDLLWIVTTQWRGQALGCAGDPNARTPRIDALAGRGIHHVAAVTPHPFGPFARAALLTGQTSPENGVAEYFDPLPAGRRTLADALNDRGYRTAWFGKWHLSVRDRSAPLVGEVHARMVVPAGRRGGFAHWEGFESGFLLNDPWLHGTELPEPRQFRGYQSDVVAGRAAAWCRAAGPAGERPPWFCVVSLEPPHPPYAAPSADVPRRDPADIVLAPNVPRGGDIEARARAELAGYHAHLEATDRAIGRLLDGLDGADPVVVFTSVHGDMHGAHGLFRKGWPYEESIRVPLIVALPAGVASAAAGRAAEVVSLLDLPAWTLAWADGRPVAADGSGREISMPSVVPLPHQCDRAWRGIRTRTRKLVCRSDGSPWLFFDLAEDPFEEHDRSADPARRGEIAELRSRLRPGN